MKFAISLALLVISMTVHSATTCKVLVKDTVNMPNGPMSFPFNLTKVLKDKGYKPAVVSYLAPKTGEYTLRINVNCGLSVFNPWLSVCDTRIALQNDEGEMVGEGVSSNTVNVGYYSADIEGALKDLPNCSQL